MPDEPCARCQVVGIRHAQCSLGVKDLQLKAVGRRRRRYRRTMVVEAHVIDAITFMVFNALEYHV